MKSNIMVKTSTRQLIYTIDWLIKKNRETLSAQDINVLEQIKAELSTIIEKNAFCKTAGYTNAIKKIAMHLIRFFTEHELNDWLERLE